MDDQELINAYARQRSEDAFKRLIDRHVNLVYSAALRQLKDPHLSEDVTQTTFIALARHASRLTGERVLSAWLLVTTRNAALDAIKARARRLRHEREAAQMATTTQNSPDEDSKWEQIAPHLDDALESLSGADDRRAISLRYFEGCTPTQVADRLGISLDAARQRVHRATTRMRGYFSKKGLDISAAALGPLIASHAVQAAPAALAAATAHALSVTIGSATAGASAAKGTLIAIIASKAKAAVIGAAALITFGAGTATVHHYIVHRRTQAVLSVAQISPQKPAAPIAESSTVIGYARTPDGKPVMGATVLVSTTHHFVRLLPGSTWKDGSPVPPFLEQGNVTVGETLSFKGVENSRLPTARQVTGWQGVTDSSGRFELHLNQPAAGVIVHSKQGIGVVLASDLLRSPQVTLRPWARVEGDLRLGNRPLAKATVIIQNLSEPEKLVHENLIIEGGAMTDDAGHFVIRQAMPGSTWMFRQVILDGKQVNAHGEEFEVMTWPPDGHTEPAHVDLPSGGTAHVSLGGTGRPIIGHVSNNLKSFTFRRATITSDPAASPNRPIHFPAATDIAEDGSFKGDDFPAGRYRLHIDVGTYTERRRSWAYLDYAASADSRFEIPLMEGGRSDTPLDLGKITLVPRPRLAQGMPVPDITAKRVDGSNFKLSSLAGKFVLLEIGGDSFPEHGDEARWLRSLHDHFAPGQRFEQLNINSETTPSITAKSPSGSVPGLRLEVHDIEKDLPREYLNSGSSLFLIDPDGKLLAMNLDAFSAYNIVDKSVKMPNLPAGIEVDHLDRGAVNSSTPFTRVPAPNPDNAARSASVKIVDGIRAENSGPPDRLVDGRMPVTEDAPTQNFKFRDLTLEGRISFDLGRVIPIAAVNSYSWQVDKRAPQVYLLYAGNGDKPGFDPAPKNGTDPASAGWTLIASVDSRPAQGPPGGRYAVRVSNPTGTLGSYRYLLFLMFPAQVDDVSGHSFYSEINVIERK